MIILVVCGCVLAYHHNNHRQTKQLLQAIKSEDIGKVKELLDRGVDPNKTDVEPILLWSLLETSPNRPLTIACGTGNAEIVKLLIDYGATAEANETTGYSPLRKTLFYFQKDDPEIIDILLQNGAQTNETDAGVEIVFIAAQMSPRVYDKEKANGTVFCSDYDETTAIGITKIVCMLLDERSVDITTNSGETLLMFSVQKENLYLSKYLISAGCDASKADINGNTALDYALKTGNEELIMLLTQ